MASTQADDVKERHVEELLDLVGQNDVSVEKVDLDGAYLGEDGVVAVACALRANTHVRSVLIGANAPGEGGLRALFDMMRSNSSITLLSVGASMITDAVVSAILSDAVGANSGLTSLDVSNNAIASSAGLLVPQNSMSNIHTISFRANRIGATGAAGLASALVGNAKLTSLNLALNNLTDTGLQILAVPLQAGNLRSLDLACNQLGPAAMECLGGLPAARGGGGGSSKRAGSPGVSLTHLSLRSNSVGDEGVAFLQPLLRAHPSLASLNLMANRISPHGAQLIAAVLSPPCDTDSPVRLARLDLSSNAVGPGEGAQAVARLLLSNGSLRALGLLGNNLGDCGAAVIAAALGGNTGLTELDLEANGITRRGAESLAAALRGPGITLQVDAEASAASAASASSAATTSSAAAASTATATNATLRKLDLWGNNIQDQGCRALLDSLHSNTSLVELDVGMDTMGRAMSADLVEGIRGYLERNRLRGAASTAREQQPQEAAAPDEPAHTRTVHQQATPANKSKL
jgi:Ran GTPase-activating protein (RanGAP) involved in mRNA processing and transport